MTMLEPDTTRDEAFQRALHRTLASSEDYLRRIHWWMRFFGCLAIAPFIFALMAVVFAATRMALHAG